MNAEQISVWKCTKCGTCFTNKEAADKCCTKPQKVCEDCGVGLDPKWYYTVCENCREKRRYNHCRKMTIEEYEKEFPDHMVVAGDDNFYSSVEDALENCYGKEEEVPYYVYGTKKHLIGVNIDSSIENALDDAYEDAEFDNTDELYEFVEEWNKRNHLTSFYESKIVIDIPEEMRQKYMA